MSASATGLREFAGPRLGMPLDQLTGQCEQAVRSHDPCISCATHFLDVRVLSRTGRPAGPEVPPGISHTAR
jgi:coenzyme F420-reducing hydrogenase alpha subunit